MNPTDPETGDTFISSHGEQYRIVHRKGSVVKYKRTWQFYRARRVVALAAWKAMVAEYHIVSAHAKAPQK